MVRLNLVLGNVVSCCGLLEAVKFPHDMRSKECITLVIDKWFSKQVTRLTRYIVV